MKIYTHSGDNGTTTLVGGKLVPKTHIRIEAYGSVDELIAHIGLLYDMSDSDIIRSSLTNVQDKLMVCAAIIATDCENCKVKIPEIFESDIKEIESLIDDMDTLLPSLKSFVLPGGHIVSSQCHIARTVCRRAERQIIRLSAELFIPETVIKYINRLSDYLFVLARKVLHDFNKEDRIWKSKL